MQQTNLNNNSSRQKRGICWLQNQIWWIVRVLGKREVIPSNQEIHQLTSTELSSDAREHFAVELRHTAVVLLRRMRERKRWYSRLLLGIIWNRDAFLRLEACLIAFSKTEYMAGAGRISMVTWRSQRTETREGIFHISMIVNPMK